VFVRPLTFIAAILASVFSFAVPCAAQEDDARTEEARQLFSEGLELAEAERYEEAAAKFRRAYVLRPAPPIAFNFGNALIESGRLVEGIEMMRQVIRDPDAPEDLRDGAEDIVEDAEPRLGQLVVQVSGDPQDAIIAVRGSPLDSTLFGVPVSADPGINEVTATRGREVVTSVEVEVPEGGRAEVSLDVPAPLPEEPVEPVVVAPPPEEPEDEGGAIVGQWWFWAGIGAVVVGAVILSVVLATSSGGVEEPILGTTQPGVLTWE
jgi:hypothetical protein